MPRFAKPPRLFAPILAGANLRDRLVACLGALVGIAVTAAVCARLGVAAHDLPIIVAPMGASAVLLFAVPASPLAQPWPMVGGNLISALVGVTVARFVPDLWLAAGLATGGAILAMSLLRCLHPPGGAAALTCVIGGPAIAAAGYAFPFEVVAVNSVVLLVAGWLFHRVSGHSYPHRAKPAAAAPAAPVGDGALHRDDIDRALADLGETFDIGAEDLAELLARAEGYAEARRGG